MNKTSFHLLLLIIFFNTSSLFSQLKVLTSFEGETSTEKEISQGVSQEMSQELKQKTALFNIRKIIMTTPYSNGGENLNRYDLDKMTLISIEEMPKYRYLEERLKFAREFDELLPYMDNDKSKQKSKLEIEYDNVNMREVVYKCRVIIPRAKQDEYTFHLDNRFEKMEY